MTMTIVCLYCFVVLLQLLMSGIKHHLDSSVEDIRTVGMVVVEIVTAKLNVTGESLKFEVFFVLPSAI